MAGWPLSSQGVGLLGSVWLLPGEKHLGLSWRLSCRQWRLEQKKGDARGQRNPVGVLRSTHTQPFRILWRARVIPASKTSGWLPHPSHELENLHRSGGGGRTQRSVSRGRGVGPHSAQFPLCSLGMRKANYSDFPETRETQEHGDGRSPCWDRRTRALAAPREARGDFPKFPCTFRRGAELSQIASASASVRPTRELKQGHCSSLGERAPSRRSIPATFPVTDVLPAAHTPTFHLPVPSTQQPEVSCETGPVGFPISGGLCELPGCRPPPSPPVTGLSLTCALCQNQPLGVHVAQPSSAQVFAQTSCLRGDLPTRCPALFPLHSSEDSLRALHQSVAP